MILFSLQSIIEETSCVDLLVSYPKSCKPVFAVVLVCMSAIYNVVEFRNSGIAWLFKFYTFSY